MYIIVDWFDLGYLGRLVDDENKCGLYICFLKNMYLKFWFISIVFL